MADGVSVIHTCFIGEVLADALLQNEHKLQLSLHMKFYHIMSNKYAFMLVKSAVSGGT